MKNMTLERIYDERPAARILITVTEDGNVYIDAADIRENEAKRGLAAAIVELAEGCGASTVSFLAEIGKLVAREALARRIGAGKRQDKTPTRDADFFDDEGFSNIVQLEF